MILLRHADPADLAKLSDGARELLAARLRYIQPITQAPRAQRGILIAAAAQALHCDPSTIHRMCGRFKSEGWRGLLDGRSIGTSRAASTKTQFENFVRSLYLQQDREQTGKEVHRTLIERWNLWRITGDDTHRIPGYLNPPPATRQGHPAGWSLATIYRLRPDAYSRAAATRGDKTASDFLPSILKTRVGTAFGQIVFFDDQDYDIRVAAPGTSQKVLRPQGFNSLDYHSGAFLDHHIRLRWWDTSAQKHRTLTIEEFTWFVIQHLQRTGYRADELGTHLVFEHGTATGYANRDLHTTAGHSNFDDALAAISHGRITVHRSGLFNSPVFADLLFRPQSSGNPNFKAPLESMFNLVRNRMAALPGPMGIDRNRKNAEQYGQDKYTETLLKLALTLPPEKAELIRYPILTATQFSSLASAVYHAINTRTDHALEGWDRLGYIAPQFRFAPDERAPWLTQADLAALPPEAAAAVTALATIPGHTRTIRLSPAAVAAATNHGLTKLQDEAIPLLIPRQWARECIVKQDRTIAIKDQLIDPEPLTYICRIETRTGAETLRPGLAVMAYLNPFAPDRCILTAQDGTYIGTVLRQDRAAWLDHAAIETQLRANAALRADLDTAVRPHLAGLAAERLAMQDHNTRLAATPQSPRTRPAKPTPPTDTSPWDDPAPDLAPTHHTSPTSPWDTLPADTEIPDAF